MSIVKFGMALIGFVACVSNPLQAASAAPFDKYLVAPLGTVDAPGAFSPFQVKASDSDDIEYLNIYYRQYESPTYPELPYIGLSHGTGLPERWVGDFFTYPRAETEIIWFPFVSPNDVSIDPVMQVYLTVEDGADEYGDVKLVADAVANCGFGLCPPWSLVYTASRGQARRMTTLNGGQIEVVPVIIRLDGAPWATYYFGYGAGLVASDVFSARLNVQSFYPVSLPPPKADGTVVEYVNTLDFPGEPGGHYFYASDPAEQAIVDAGGAGRFARTGRSFASGGFVPVCRFYGSMSPGPNSHFFTASESECAGLKSMQAVPTPADTQQWNFEGNGFYSVMPVQDAQGQMRCMGGTAPVYRAYNNAYPASGGKNPWDSNHRYSTQTADIDEMASKGWVPEGIAFCAPVAAQ